MIFAALEGFRGIFPELSGLVHRAFRDFFREAFRVFLRILSMADVLLL